MDSEGDGYESDPSRQQTPAHSRTRGRETPCGRQFSRPGEQTIASQTEPQTVDEFLDAISGEPSEDDIRNGLSGLDISREHIPGYRSSTMQGPEPPRTQVHGVRFGDTTFAGPNDFPNRPNVPPTSYDIFSTNCPPTGSATASSNAGIPTPVRSTQPGMPPSDVVNGTSQWTASSTTNGAPQSVPRPSSGGPAPSEDFARCPPHQYDTRSRSAMRGDNLSRPRSTSQDSKLGRDATQQADLRDRVQQVRNRMGNRSRSPVLVDYAGRPNPHAEPRQARQPDPPVTPRVGNLTAMFQPAPFKGDDPKEEFEPWILQLRAAMAINEVPEDKKIELPPHAKIGRGSVHFLHTTQASS